MSKTIKNKLVVLLSVMMIACVSIGVGVFGFAGASTPFTFSDFAFNKMASSVMIDGEDGKDGLTFSVTTSLEDYDGLKGIVGEGKDYVSMETGIIIAPNYYNDNVAINKASVFDKDATYDYAEWNGENYVYNGNKIRVININANDWKVVDNEMVYTGSIVDILSKNIAEEFYAVAYVKVTDSGGNENYVFSQSVVTSMAYETQIAIENETLGDKASYAQANFVDVVTEKYTYTTEYYKKVVDGYELIESVVSEETYKLDTIVNAEIKNYQEDNLEYIEGYEKEVLSGKVKANDKLTLKVYYGDAEAEVINFNTLSNVVVTKGAKVLIETPAPVDQYGKLLTVYFDVVGANGEHVTTFNDEDGEYFYADGTEYTISYAVYPYDKQVTLKTTTVQVAGVETVNVNYDKVVEVGSEVAINAVSGLYNPVFTYTVTKDADASGVAVVDGKFTPDTVGYYTVNVKATYLGKEAETSYKVYARNPIQKGEVETFNTDWAEIRKVNNYGTHGWTLTNTEETGIKNAFGVSDTFITMAVTSQMSSATLWVDPVLTVEQYRKLVADGFTKVVLYVYTDASQSVPMTFIADNVNDSHLNVDKDGTLVGDWTKVEINLIEDVGVDECLDRSFISGFSVYENERNGFLTFKNTIKADFNVYVSDIYAVKEVSLTANADAKVEYETGDNVDLSTLINCDKTCDYYITNLTAQTETEKITSKNYMFKSSGNYVIKAVPTERAYDGTLTINVTVTDDVVANKTWTKVKMEGDSLAIDFKDLGITLTQGANAVSVNVTAVTFHDDYKLEVSNGRFTVTEAGYYKVYLEGTYGDGFKTYKQVDLDVYTDEDALVLTNSEDIIATRYWAYQKMPTVGYQEYTVRGITDTMFSYRASTGAMVTFFRPMYSKVYYQDLIDNNNTCQVLFRFYTENNTGKTLFAKFIDNYGQKEMIDYDHEKLIDLSYFVTNYDKFASGYARELKVVQSGGNPVYDFVTNRYDYLFATNNNAGNNIYFRDMPVLISYTDNTENMLDVSTLLGTTFDATTTMNDDAKAVVNGYSASDITYRYVDVFGNEVSGKDIDVTKASNKRLWRFEARFGTTVVYTGYVDIYDSADGFVWNTNPQWTLYTGEALTNQGNGVTSSMVKGETTVATTLFTSTDDYFGGANYLTFANRPIHSKTYYEAYRDKVTFAYSIYFMILDKDGNPDTTNLFAANMLTVHNRWSYKTQVLYWGSDKGATHNNTWCDRTFSINALLDNWTYAECEGQRIKDWADRESYGLIFIYNPQNESISSAHGVHLTELTYTVSK